MNLQINGLNINYKLSGNGEKTVIILQGWGTKLEYYDSIAALLKEKYRVLQFDFPGFGGSDEPKEPWGVSEYTDMFVELIGKLGINKASLIGHSFGGRVILKLAGIKNTGFEAEKILLVDSAGILPKKTFAQKFKIRQYKLLKKIYANKVIYFLFPEIVDEWKSRQGSEDYRNASQIMRACLVKTVNEDLTENLSLIKNETLIVWGEKDDSTPLSDARLMNERIEDSGLVVIPGAGHFSYLERQDIFNPVLCRFFETGEQ